jgi:hypothetical protein
MCRLAAIQLLRTALLLALALSATVLQAAKPGSTTQAASGSPPEIYRSSIDYTGRALTVHGIHLITGSYGSPEYPLAVSLGGAAVAIDNETSRDGTDFGTNKGPLIIPFDNILVALPALIVDGALPAEINFVVKIATAGGTVIATAYLAQPMLEVSSPPEPPSTGSCPCSNLYDQYYTALYALLWPTCTAPGSSNATSFVPTEQYIEASYIDELYIRTITISSDSSISPRNSGSTSYVSSCSVRTDGGAYLAGPVPVSDSDHDNCVADIIAREPICRGGNWLDP